MDNQNSSILGTEKASENDKLSSQDKKNISSKNTNKVNVSLYQKYINTLKRTFKKIKNYPVNFLVSLYMIFHSGVSLSYLFGLNSFGMDYYSRDSSFAEYSLLRIEEFDLFLGFSLSFFLFLVYKFFYSTSLKKMFNYSLVFNLVFMILYIYFQSKSIVTTI